MYIPRLFRQDDPELLFELMRENSFATLISQHEGQLLATHIPFLVDSKVEPHGTLRGHMARANPQWKGFREDQEVLVIFQGPHAYVSPSWYEERLSVPTWNYAVVHAYGIPRLLEDPEQVYSVLERSVNTYEAQFEKPWRFDLPDDYTGKMIQSITGFEIQITRLEGKFKLSQNRPLGDQQEVAEHLKQNDNPTVASVGKMMEKINGLKSANI